jgi:hypothetical protein
MIERSGFIDDSDHIQNLEDKISDILDILKDQMVINSHLITTVTSLVGREIE